MYVCRKITCSLHSSGKKCFFHVLVVCISDLLTCAQDCQIPGDMTFTKFFEERILKPITTACADRYVIMMSLYNYYVVPLCRSKVVLIPSQRDIHHPYAVYPQPPLPTPHTRDTLHSYSDPTTLTVNGVYVGVTSTDVLFHLSARTMFKGWVGLNIVWIGLSDAVPISTQFYVQVMQRCAHTGRWLVLTTKITCTS